MQSLPTELGDKIVSHLPVDSVYSFYHATALSKECSRVFSSCERRISIKKFLDQKAGNGSVILRSMESNFVYLSGSTSLDFFKPGSDDESSDLDFYAPDSIAHVSSFMYALETIGVTWQTPLQRVLEIAERQDTDVQYIRAPVSTLVPLLNCKKLLETGIGFCARRVPSELMEPDFKGECYLKIDRENRWLQIVSVTSAPTPVHLHEDFRDHYDTINARAIIYGKLSVGTSQKMVQIIAENRAHPLDVPSIFLFHSSCVQSYINAHVACHLYGSLTDVYTNISWPNNIRGSTSRGAIRKYERRGYKTVPSHRSAYDYMHANGSQSTLICGYNLNEPTGVPDSELRSSYCTAARGIVWMQTEGGVFPFNHSRSSSSESAYAASFASKAYTSTEEDGYEKYHEIALAWGVSRIWNTSDSHLGDSYRQESI